MAPQSNSNEIKREVQATLAARRELGPDYDEQFLNALVEKLARPGPVQQTPAHRPPQRSSGALSSGQRVAVAICSLVFAIPLLSIAGAFAGGLGILLVCCAILGINFAAS